ncbi:uncharacterized protein RCC_07369 [Ramularia collo-cygni]|uniref:60S ribosomal protein L41 n=2 Tax=leotiomyceta TaxID=716546 RepID=A0A2D3VCP2_9PEZI|nr:uncharacterized protein RCC_07369 [Ramularia collo-cygni]CZT21506.1 uncharacterized protein RCC_07369 [Ramularia collo-cygni]
MRAKWRKKRVRRLKKKRRKTRARSKLIIHRNDNNQSRDQHTNSALKEGSAPDGGLRWRTNTSECGGQSKDGINEPGVTGSVYHQEIQKL